MTASTLPAARLVLFDLGGVLLRLNDPLATFDIDATPADFAQRWLASPAVRAHETGRIDAREFARRAISEFGLSCSVTEFVARFNAWPDRVTADTVAVVRRIPAAYSCAILSNTNELHWRNYDIERIFGGRIGRCYISCRTGLLKPDPRAFMHVVDDTQLAPASILFFDDNPANVAAARECGMRARLCRGVDALPGLLRAEGVVPAG